MEGLAKVQQGRCAAAERMWMAGNYRRDNGITGSLLDKYRTGSYYPRHASLLKHPAAQVRALAFA
jgi:hypothetical protein